MKTASKTLTEDLELARLVVCRLAKMIKGVLTVGIAALHLEHTAEFFQNQEKKHAAFIEVLQSTCDSATTASENSKQLAHCSRQFFLNFRELMPWQTLSADRVEQTADGLLSTYEASLQSLQAVANGLDMKLDLQIDKDLGREFIRSFVKELAANEPQNQN